MRKWSAAAALALASSLLPGGSAGAQVVTCVGQSPTIVDNGPGDQDPRPHYILGTPGADVILGTEENDIIDGNVAGPGSLGTDLICGGDGNDMIYFGGFFAPHNARIDGGDGNDTVTTSGFVEVLGGPGNDTLRGSGVVDSSFSGGDGNDTIIVLALSQLAPTNADGGAGNDYLQVETPAGRILGGTGNDVLRTTRTRFFFSPFIVNGGPGNDDIEHSNGTSVDVLGGDGHDRIVVDRISFSRVDGGPASDVCLGGPDTVDTVFVDCEVTQGT
jgi:hypothetical protein